MKRGKIAKALDYLDEELIVGVVENNTVEKKATVRQKSERNRSSKNLWIRAGAIAAATAILVTGGIVISKFVGVSETTAIIAFDVNPSLELEINKKEEVEKVRALNEEAEIVLGDMDLIDVDLDVAVNAIIGSMLQNGYLTAEQNSILISVDAGDNRMETSLKENVSNKVTQLLNGSNIEASVITQSFEKETVKDKAEKDNISAAKATLIDKIIAAGLVDSYGIPYEYQDLVGLKVNELKLMLESKGIRVEGIDAKGEAGKGKFISKQQALEIAYADANVVAEDVVEVEIEMDFDKHVGDYGVMTYEIEFETEDLEYEYEIDAETGDIRDKEIDGADEEDEDEDEDDLPEGCISKDEALELTCGRAGIAVENVTDYDIDVKIKRGWVLYDIEIEAGENKYHFILDAKDGKIYAERVEHGNAHHPNEGAPEYPKNGYSEGVR